MDKTASPALRYPNTMDNENNETQRTLVVPSCYGIPKRATDLCDHFQIRPPIPTYETD